MIPWVRFRGDIMRQSFRRFVLITLLGCLAAQSRAAEPAGWGYEGETGPSAWGRLNPAWALCESGRNQSPIDIRDTIEAELPPLELYAKFTVRTLRDTGETEQVVSDDSAVLHVDGVAFALDHMHFHAPSENRVDGQEFPLEAHLVHASGAGELAVVSVLFQIGAANRALVDIGDRADGRSVLPDQAGMQDEIDITFPTADLLPANRDYFRFSGSLTTPPCTEGVRWLVLKSPATASAEQIDSLAKAIGVGNNRPIQAHFGRPILR